MAGDAGHRVPWPGMADTGPEPVVAEPVVATYLGVRALAASLAAIALVCLLVAVVGMVTGRPGDRAGTLLRALALISFVAAVVVNSLR
jgi:hypothetical protein